MRILVMHQNFPGQYGHLVRAWSGRPGWEVRGLGQSHAPGLPGFSQLMRYRPTRAARPDQHPYLRPMENAVLNGQAAARAMLRMQRTGFRPDVIVGHPGWGETLYAKDVFPQARLVHLCEWYYSAEGADVGFDPEFPASLDDKARVRTWNAQHALSLLDCDAAVSPTHWQRSRYPQALQSKIAVQHEGIDTGGLRPNPDAWVKTLSSALLKVGDPVITYVARNLEPYRGFHVFMRALAKIQKHHAKCHALVIGGDDVSYGKPPKSAQSWREYMLKEVQVDPARTHFLGHISRANYVRVLQVSAAHVYLTYPFVLSWSLLEAMACGAPIVASDTAPVREVIHGKRGGRLPGFFDTEGIADAVMECLEDPIQARLLGASGQSHVQSYSLNAGVQGYDRLVLPS